MKTKIYYYSKSLLAVAFALLLGTTWLTSCKDEEATDKIVLESFGPSGVEHGDKIEFIGINLDKVTSIVLPGAEVSSSQFTTQSGDLIELIVPDAAEAGIVTLKTPQGDIETKTPLDFLVPITITSITAEARPGATISIKGNLVNWIEQVTFNDGISTTEFVSKSTSEVVITVPMDAQTGFLIFKSGGTKPLTFASKAELIVTVPMVTSLTPSLIKHTDNLTIAGADLDLITSIDFSGDKTVTEFVSQSPTEIVVEVPVGATKGALTLRQASPIFVVTGEITIILPVGTSVAPKPAKPGVDNITITGTDLDLVGVLTLPGGVPPISAASFVSQSATEIVLAVPDGAKSGGINYTTIHGYTYGLGVSLIVPGAGPPPLAITMYDDNFEAGHDWSWAGTGDPASTEQFYSGDNSWKFESTGGGGPKNGGIGPFDASAQGVFVFSLYGGAGTNGASVAAILMDDTGDVWGSYNAVTIVEGQWKEYRLPLSLYSAAHLNKVSGWLFKVEGMPSSTIYVDRVGFDPAGPTPLGISLYDEAIAPGGGDWSWGGTSSPGSTEQAYIGNVSWKFESTGNGGLSSGGITAIDASGSTYFSFSLYGGPGTDGKSVACILNDNWTDYHSVTLAEGKWTEYKVPLTGYGTTDLTQIVRFAFKMEDPTTLVMYADRVGFE